MNNMKNQYNTAVSNNFPIVDGHFDLLSLVERRRGLGFTKVIENDYLPEYIESGVNIVVSSLFIDDIFLPEMGLKKALGQISALYAEIRESPDKIMLCRTYDDIEKAVDDKKLGIILSFEGVEPLTNDLSLLKIFYELGVRIVGLVWNNRNYAADGCYSYNLVQGQKGGLTDFGIKLVEKAEDMGMFIDVSHLNEEGFWDVMKVAKKPVIASHSNCRVLANSMRNLTDEQIKALALKNGVIGMNVCSSFVADKDEDCDVSHLLNHVDHIVNLTGVEHVGVGFDFCDALRAFAPDVESKFMRKSFDVIKGYRGIKEFTEGLTNRGYSNEDISLILGGNFLNIYKQLLKG